jgi:hypothetical protein
MKPLNQTSVISICSRAHADVWQLTSKLLIKYVEADFYTVYVPEGEIQFFKKVTPAEIRIESQESLGNHYEKELVTHLSSTNMLDRKGFYKIEALRSSTSKLTVIWDADCVPTQKIPLISSDGKPIFLDSSREMHQPYFDTIQKLLGQSRAQDMSFVIPGFPYKSEWISEFISFVEKRHDAHWYQAIANCTDFSHRSGFSETETLGTWMTNQYPGEWIAMQGTWERFGQTRFGYARDLNAEEVVELGLKHNLQVISFENWDKKNFRYIFRRLRYRTRGNL